MGILSRKHVLVAGAAAIALAAATPAMAQQRTFDVPAQSANKAIPEFARQAGIQIVAPGSVLRGKRTQRVKGDLDIRAALARLLEGTDLRIASDDGTTITLARRDVGNGQGGADIASSSGGDVVPESQRGISEILVVGSRSQNVDIRRTEDDAQPYVVFDKEQIERSGAESVENFLRTRLPQNAQVSANNQATSGSSQAGSINLRGLGCVDKRDSQSGRLLIQGCFLRSSHGSRGFVGRGMGVDRAAAAV